MLPIAISLAVGVLGVLLSRAVAGYVLAQSASTDPHVYWGIGLLALLPAWLVTFLGLLGSSPEPQLPVRAAAAWIISAAAALVGAIATEALVRGASESGRGRSSTAYWAYGVATLVPAWVASIIGNIGK